MTFATVPLPSKVPSLLPTFERFLLAQELPRHSVRHFWVSVGILMFSHGIFLSLRRSQLAVGHSPAARILSRLCTIPIFTLILCMWLGPAPSVTVDLFAAGEFSSRSRGQNQKINTGLTRPDLIPRMRRLATPSSLLDPMETTCATFPLLWSEACMMPLIPLSRMLRLPFSPAILSTTPSGTPAKYTIPT